MGEANELVVVLGILTQTANGNGHAALEVAVEAGLRSVVLGEVVDELLRCARELELLGLALELLPELEDLLLGGLLLEAYEYGCRVAVRYRHAQALGRDGRGLCLHDLAVLDGAPYLQRLLLGLLLLAADERDQVIDHLRPGLEGLAGAGDRLIGAGEDLGQAELLLERMQGGNVALDGAVGLDGDEAALGAQTCALCGDDLEVLRVDLRHDHGDIRREAMGGIVGDDGALCLGIALLEGADLVLLHIDGAEHEVHIGNDAVHVGVQVTDDHVGQLLRHRHGHRPAAANGLAVGLAGAARRGGEHLDVEPRMLCEQRRETLADHAGGTQDTYIILLHNTFLLFGRCAP